MSQVDYLHFFNNMMWNLGQFLGLYMFMSMIYVQSFYKVFSLRLVSYNKNSARIKTQDYGASKWMDKGKELHMKFSNFVKSYKSKKTNTKNLLKWFYE